MTPERRIAIEQRRNQIETLCEQLDREIEEAEKKREVLCEEDARLWRERGTPEGKKQR